MLLALGTVGQYTLCPGTIACELYYGQHLKQDHKGNPFNSYKHHFLDYIKHLDENIVKPLNTHLAMHADSALYQCTHAVVSKGNDPGCVLIVRKDGKDVHDDEKYFVKLCVQLFIDRYNDAMIFTARMQFIQKPPAKSTVTLKEKQTQRRCVNFFVPGAGKEDEEPRAAPKNPPKAMHKVDGFKM